MRAVLHHQQDGTDAEKTYPRDGPAACSSASVNKKPVNLTRSTIFYNFGPDSQACHSTPNRSYGCYNDDTLNDSVDGIGCAKTGMGMGSFVGSFVNAFVIGMTGGVEHGENLRKYPTLSQDVSGDIQINAATTNCDNKGLPIDVVTTTMPPGSQNEDRLNDKIDVLLKLLKENEATLTKLQADVKSSMNCDEKVVHAETGTPETQQQAAAGVKATISSDAGIIGIVHSPASVPSDVPVNAVATNNSDGYNKVLPTNVVATTPCPDPQTEGFLNDEMDELIELFKDKEAKSSDSKSQSSAEIAAIVSKLQAEVKSSSTDSEKVKNAKTGTAEPQQETSANAKATTGDTHMTDIGAQVIDMMRTMNPIGFNESAISKASELSGIAYDLKFDPTVDQVVSLMPFSDVGVDVGGSVDIANETEDKSNLILIEAVMAEKKKKTDQDDLSFEFNSKGLSISGAVEPMSVVAPKAEQKVSGDNKKTFLSTPCLPVYKAFSDADKENDGATENDMATKKSRRGLRMKKIVKNIKNVPKDIKNAKETMEEANESKRAANADSSSATKKTNKKSEAKKNKKIAYSVNISVEAPKENERKQMIIKHLEQHQCQPFIADFSSTSAVDSMGFPLDATPKQGNDNSLLWEASFSGNDNDNSLLWEASFSGNDKPKQDNDNILLWEASFSGNGNPFAAASRDNQGCCAPVANEAKICAWCKKGGASNPDIVKKLKLCSRCRVIHYCSSECQLQDWNGGHRWTCQVVQDHQ